MTFITQVDAFYQEGLKQHEGGQNQPNPFDVFSNFFGGRLYHGRMS
jgi:hypothetical protein